jgi:hypothetical protein
MNIQSYIVCRCHPYAMNLIFDKTQVPQQVSANPFAEGNLTRPHHLASTKMPKSALLLIYVRPRPQHKTVTFRKGPRLFKQHQSSMPSDN